jgi:hypothetical protein
MIEEKLEPLLPPELGPQRHVAAESLRRVQKLLGEKSRYLGTAMAFTALSLMSVPAPAHSLMEALRKGGQPLSIAFFVAGLVVWLYFLRACARLKGSGLGPAKGMGPRTAWSSGGFVIAVALLALVDPYLPDAVNVPILMGMSFLSIYLGERLNQVVTADKISVVDVPTLLDADEKDEE